MNLFERVIRIAQSEFKDFTEAHLPPIEEALKQGAQRVGDTLDHILTEAENHTYKKKGKYSPEPNSRSTPRTGTNPSSSAPAFSDFSHFTKVLKAGGIDDRKILKLTDIAHQKGFTPALKDWLANPENEQTVLVPFTRLLKDRAQPGDVRDRIFFRSHNLGLAEDVLGWLKTEPALVDSVGMDYANFYAQIKKRAPACVDTSERMTFTDDEIREAKQFAKKISNDLRAR